MTDSPAGPAIVAHELTRSFAGRPALDGLSLEAHPGEVLVLLGPNGAGKTTTIRLLNGVLRPDRGSSRVLGLDPAVQGDDVRRRTGVLTENAGLDDRLTARENLLSVGRIRGIPRSEAARRADTLLEQFGIGASADRRVQGFSTGERKRVALGRALLHDPEVLFLDEPTAGLDPAAARDVIDLLASLARERGRTVVLCTHVLAEAGRLAHRMAVLADGRLRAIGTPAEIAAGLWDALEAEVDLGGPAPADVLDRLRVTPGVRGAAETLDGARVWVHDRDALAAVVATCVGMGQRVYAAVPHPPTVEDVYFALLGGDVEHAGPGPAAVRVAPTGLAPGAAPGNGRVPGVAPPPPLPPGAALDARSFAPAEDRS